jgi:MFS family permease
MSRVARAARPHARVVVVLGWVSFWNDTASEMLTPLLPLFLTTTLGAGPATVGVVEGIAEATSSVLKFVSGRLADRGWSAGKLVLGGYSVSNAARPLLGLATGWGHVLTLRFLDRVGKGVRTAPRDALIAVATTPRERGGAFGFQRAMDHAGSTLGPVIAFLLLQAGVALRNVFLASIVPGAIVLTLLVFGLSREPRAAPTPRLPPLRWRGLDPRVRALVLAAGGLALATTPEAFLVLWAAERGLSLVWVPILWAVAHGAKALVSAPAGRLSDRIGRLPVVVAGWGARIAVLVAIATAQDGPATVWLLFTAHGVALASTEAAERALIGDLAPPAQKATAFGLYHLCTWIFALPGAVLFGAIWQRFGPEPAFVTAAGLTALAAGALVAIARAGAPRR